MKIVILAEKPSQAKAYAEAFQVAKREKTHIELKPTSIFPNAQIYITWAIGHLVELKMPQEYKEEWAKWNLKNLPIIPEQFEFKVSKDKKEQFNAVKKLFKEADMLISAVDIDREGSNIFYSILEMTGVKNKPVKRLWINSLEVDEIQKGFKNLRDNEFDLKLYDEAKARQLGDWLVGINASQLYTLLLQQKGVNEVLSVGRVQSPLVYMIYQRQVEIENFKSEPFYELVGHFKSPKGEYQGKAKVKEKERAKVTSLLNELNLIEGVETDGVIKTVEKTLKREKSPRLHSLSTLQTVANKKWKYSPAVVLSTMQSLYEKKIVTYPRTDCNYITESEFAYLSNNVEEMQKLIGVSFAANKEPNKRFVDNSKVQEHYAIVPTKSVPSIDTINALSEAERNIFYEILKVTLAMFYTDYVYEETNIITDVKSLEFLTKGRIEVEKGWKMLFSNEKNEGDEKTASEKALPSLSEKDSIVGILKTIEGHTSPPKPFSEGGLINLMKTAGKMVEDVEDSEILKEVEGIGTEATRSGIIETVKKNGYIEVKKNIVSVTEKGKILCEAINETLLASPSMTAKWESYLQKIGKGNGTKTAFLNNIQKFLNSLIDEAPKKFETAALETVVSSQQEKMFIGGCPVCKKGKLVDRKTFIGCNEYQNGCKFSIAKKIANKSLTAKNIKDLIEKGKTAKIKGFKSKAGKSFDAVLVIKDDKITFDFS